MPWLNAFLEKNFYLRFNSYQRLLPNSSDFVYWNRNPYGTITFPTANLPISNAQGTLVGNCAVPVQTSGTASATCVVAVTSGVFNTSALVCMAEPAGGRFNFGVQVTGASALPGGQQTLTMNIREE